MAVVTSARAPRPGGQWVRFVIIGLAVLYLTLPLLSTVMFSVATVWSRTIFPEGYTLR